jgi:hypothetical protein
VKQFARSRDAGPCVPGLRGANDRTPVRNLIWIGICNRGLTSMKPTYRVPLGRHAVMAICAVAGLATATGCPSEFGRQFDRNAGSKPIHGLDQTAIRSMFGEPLAKQPLVGQKCAERWMWFYGRKSIAAMVSHSLMVNFDEKGIVCEL